MKSITSVLFACLLTLTNTRACEPALATGSSYCQSEKEINIPASWNFIADPALPSVLILGDSISIGYTLPLRAQLAGRANVFRPLTNNGKGPENCNGTTFAVQNIDRWLAGQKWDVIHFNWGLHDLKHVSANDGQNSNRASDPYQADPATYAKQLEIIVKKLKATHAKLIFATTTPVAPQTTNPLREEQAPQQYNQEALKIMKSYQIPCNDLYALCTPKLHELQLPKNVHFTEKGYQEIARQVATAITKTLEK